MAASNGVWGQASWMVSASRGQPLQPSLLDRLTDEQQELDYEIGVCERRIESLKAKAAALQETSVTARADTGANQGLGQLEQHLKELNYRKRIERTSQRTFTLSMFRKSVLRDLNWLFNASNLAEVEDLSSCPETTRSVLNFGLPDLTGRYIKGTSAQELEGILRQAIVDFEPRILPDSIRVRLLRNADDKSHNALVFDIEGELQAEPYPIPLHLRTELDLEGGSVSLKQTEGGGKD